MSDNGYHCPRCINGTLIKDTTDILCMNCGFRLVITSKRQVTKDYLTEAIIARMISDGSGEIDDILDRDFKLAGMATK